MIPVRLTLKNFMSYGEDGQTLSFDGIHVACLSGDNGNGKSALLDAMTWALWGKTRASTVQNVTEDDLIRRSADEMEVRFEFELNEQKYRVVKKRKRGRTGDWQFAQAAEDGQYSPIGGGGSREVGRQITQLLSMEYETFLASAYLQQGHADEFTRQKPAQRKQILGEILDLGQYDQLETKARERSRARKAVLDELDGEIRMLEAQADRRAAAEADLDAVRAAAAALEYEREVQEAVATDLREKRVRLNELARRRDAMEAAMRSLHQEQREADAACVAQQARLKGLHELLNQRDSILQDYRALVFARQKREQLEPEVQEHIQKSAEHQGIVSDIEMERTRLLGEIKTCEQKAHTAGRQAVELERLDRQIAELATEVSGAPELDRDLNATEAETEQLREQFETLRARNREITEAIKELAEVLELLQRPQAACPVCESDLAGSKRERVLERQSAKQQALNEDQARVQREGSACKRALEAAQSRVTELRGKRDTLTASRSRLEESRRTRDTLACAPAELAEAKSSVAALRHQIETGSFALPRRVQLRRLEQDLERLKEARAEYDAVVLKARNLAQAEVRHGRLMDAEHQVDAEQQELERRGGIVASKVEALKVQQTELSGLDASLREIDAVRVQTERAETELARISSEIATSGRREGALLGFVRDCESAALLCKQKQNSRRLAHEEQLTFERLAACFGKKGIQALIIENAIPELEEEANDLLSRMTDNGMQLRFLTTRTGRSGKAEIETLDISITDEAGARPYELFSGGEAFRVNFAIRIALSRILARRSGARLQTLILDEGFGTQDGKGREKLVEAIDAIKGDFEKILVITHVEELKDSFPQRIEVSKDGKGSKIYVY